MPLPASSPAEDDLLMRRYAAGDAGAAAALISAHAPRVLALARRMLGEAAEAEDVAQEAMLRLWRAAPDWRAGEAGVGAWLRRVAGNLCLDRLRRRRESPAAEPPDLPDDRPAAVDRLAQDERAAALRAALADLPDRQRLAIVLRHFDERPNPEIAAILETSVEAVESLLARGRRELAARLIPRRAELELRDGTN